MNLARLFILSLITLIGFTHNAKANQVGPTGAGGFLSGLKVKKSKKISLSQQKEFSACEKSVDKLVYKLSNDQGFVHSLPDFIKRNRPDMEKPVEMPESSISRSSDTQQPVEMPTVQPAFVTQYGISPWDYSVFENEKANLESRLNACKSIKKRLEVALKQRGSRKPGAFDNVFKVQDSDDRGAETKEVSEEDSSQSESTGAVSQ